jgi:hypothetical protein
MLGDLHMKSLVNKFLLLGVALLIALPIAAQEKKKKNGAPGQIGNIQKSLGKIELKEEQKKKIDGIFAEFTPKLQDASKKAGDAPKRINEAKKKLQEEGKKGKDLNEAVKNAVTLSDDEKAAVADLEKLNAELRSAVAAVLTDEQKEAAGFNKGKKKKNQ